MEVDKIRNLSEDELALEERKTGEQLFRLRFQMKLGQTEGVKKLRDLRKDIARIKTIARERQLGLNANALTRTPGESAATKAEAARAKKKAAKPARKKAVAKGGSARKTSGRGTGKTAGGRTTKRAAARTGKVKKG
ncbi:MAG TPA: 50S ribosomal protein L29 [Acidobacteriaceae bacterium]|nr:50S ribosomal protein L29 [Acidobacteriaceae bacterium]